MCVAKKTKTTINNEAFPHPETFELFSFLYHFFHDEAAPNFWQ
jgi:hypothetical protein